MLRHPYLVFFSRVILGFVFILAGMDKIVFPDAFAASIEAYKLAPYAWINVIALVLPWMELVCGIFLLGGVYLRGSSVIVSSLLVFFIFAVISAMLRELKIDCGCFGKEHATPVSWMKVVENTGLTLLGLHILYYATKRKGEATAPPATAD
jgi:hypothetical protein